MINCIIIDDEPLAVEVVESYCNAIGSLNILKTFSNALDATNYMRSTKNIDLILCDIEMPNFTGVDFIKSLQNYKPFVIFTTAYHQYALDGYELNVIDYLVKPIPFPRFVQAINKVKDLKILIDSKSQANLASAGIVNHSHDDFIFVKSEYENIKLPVDEILYVQGLKDYLKIHRINKKPILTLMNFNDIQMKLPDKYFIRVHRSYLININKISAIQKTKILLEDIKIPIGESYKSLVYKRFNI